MNYRVLKFVLPTPRLRGDPIARVPGVPYLGRVLSVGVQDSAIVVWIETPETTTGFEDREFLVANTGTVYELGDLAFVGTVMVGEVIWHVFEVPRHG